MEYFFGKATIYPSFPEKGLHLLLFFLRKHFGTWETELGGRLDRMVIPKNPVRVKHARRFRKVLTESDFRDDYKILKREIQQMGVNIPPLVNTYMNLSPSMRSFGAGINDEFGDVIETGILIKFDEMSAEKTHRHLNLPNFKEIQYKLLHLRKKSK